MTAVPGMIVERMRCPRCGAPVECDAEGVHCADDHRYGYHHGYLDFSAQAAPQGSTGRTFASFGYEWNAFDGVRDEDEAFAEIYFRDLDLEGLAGKVGLDAGCGKGRFTRILARHLEAEVALDGSSAVEAAARNLADRPNVLVVKSDLRATPFAPESFDFISSLGVLHHLDDPREGFRSLLNLLAPGGQMLLYLYSRPATFGARSVALSLATALRKVSVRLSHPVLKALSTPIAALLYAGTVVPGRWGGALGRLRPGRPTHGHLPGQALPQPGPRHLRPPERAGGVPLRVVGPAALVRRGGHGGRCEARRDRLVHRGAPPLTGDRARGGGPAGHSAVTAPGLPAGATRGEAVPAAPEVSVCVLVLADVGLIGACLDSIPAATTLSVETVVVVNGTPPASAGRTGRA